MPAYASLMAAILLRRSTVVTGQSVVRNRLPRRRVGHEHVRRRPHARVALDGAQADEGGLAGVGVGGPQRRAALAAEHLVEAAPGRARAQVLLAGEEREGAGRDPRGRRRAGARAVLAASAVAVDRRHQRLADLEAHGPAAAAAGEWEGGIAHGGPPYRSDCPPCPRRPTSRPAVSRPRGRRRRACASASTCPLRTTARGSRSCKTRSAP